MTGSLTVRQYEARFRIAERALKRRINAGGDLSNKAAALLVPKAVFPAWSELAPSDFPTFTLLRLEMAARCDFASGLQLLGDRWMSYGAEAFARALLEATRELGDRPDGRRARVSELHEGSE